MPSKQACLLRGLLCFGRRGKLRREKCNMLQKSLVGMALRVNVRKKKASLEEKNATYCKNLL